MSIITIAITMTIAIGFHGPNNENKHNIENRIWSLSYLLNTEK